jgi:hypothetical protein
MGGEHIKLWLKLLDDDLNCGVIHRTAFIVAPESRNASKSLRRMRRVLKVGLRARNRPGIGELCVLPICSMVAGLLACDCSCWSLFCNSGLSVGDVVASSCLCCSISSCLRSSVMTGSCSRLSMATTNLDLSAPAIIVGKFQLSAAKEDWRAALAWLWRALRRLLCVPLNLDAHSAMCGTSFRQCQHEYRQTYA